MTKSNFDQKARELKKQLSDFQNLMKKMQQNDKGIIQKYSSYSKSISMINIDLRKPDTGYKSTFKVPSDFYNQFTRDSWSIPGMPWVETI